MGCRVGYLYLNMVHAQKRGCMRSCRRDLRFWCIFEAFLGDLVEQLIDALRRISTQVPTIYFGLMQGASVLQRFVPIETGVGFLLWVGLQITASGFERDQTPEGWRHGPAVAIGLVPSLAAWGWQVVSTTFIATRDLFCEGQPDSSCESTVVSVTALCKLELEDIIQKASTPINANSPLAGFQGQVTRMHERNRRLLVVAVRLAVCEAKHRLPSVVPSAAAL